MIDENQIQNQIDEILDYLDFEKVQKVMTFLDWKWAVFNAVPTIPELRIESRRLLRSAFKQSKEEFSTPNETYIAACGGFTAECIKYLDTESNDIKFHLKLSFNIAEWESS